MYKYPISNIDYFLNLVVVTPKEHSMGDSLGRYMEMKIHPYIEKNEFKKIIVRGLYDHSKGVSCKEKNNKNFNYIRPTANIEGKVLYINCFPGIDYVFHYGNIIKSFTELNGKEIEVVHSIPLEEECWNAIVNSELKNIPKVNTVIMGYVEGIENISDDAEWNGNGDFLWKRVKLSSGDGILLGCKHSYWGEISGRIVEYLAVKGIKSVIYFGKLGTLNPSLIPNSSIATGDTSILPNGEIIKWDNLFDNVQDSQIHKGVHITVPSVMQETKSWLDTNKEKVDFVDPEIGHMAKAAINSNITFSYLHIISDNLSKKFNNDLSNERAIEVLENRKLLCKKIEKIMLSI